MAVSWEGSKFWLLQRQQNIGVIASVNANSQAQNPVGTSSGLGSHSEQMNRSFKESGGEPAQKSFVEASHKNHFGSHILMLVF